MTVGAILEVGLGTLRAGVATMGVDRQGGAEVAGMTAVKVSMSDCSATLCVGKMGATGERVDEFCKAYAMSWRLVMMVSLDELVGRLTLVGNQETVSHIRMARVVHIQTR